MASKKTKANAADDIDDLFSGIGDNAMKPSASKPPKATSAASKAIGDQDIFADIESQLSQQPSRPHTPRLKEAGSRRPTATPPIPDDKAPTAAPRKPTDSTSHGASFTPSATSSELHEAEKAAPVEPAQQAQPAPQQASGGGWWGGILSTASATASAAMKQAEAAYKEIQQNEEAKKWAEQVRGLNLDVNTLKNYGDEIRARALPTFTNILHTIAPPISSHERLLIHITHDLVGYPSLDPLIHEAFQRVMSQVEGGDLLVVQRGQESTSRRSTDGSAGWRDGPWWRQSGSPRELGLIQGLTEGTKLCRASAESYANEYYAAHGGVQEAKIRATQALSETNPVRTSDIFLAIQAVVSEVDKGLFAATASDAPAAEEEQEVTETIQFAVFILDPVHEISYSTLSQAVPAKWLRWLETPASATPESADGAKQKIEHELPDEIREIIEGGGIDPREWVAEWVEEVISLSVGVIAQRYVARRMGVNEGGLGRSRRTIEEVVQENAGEAARAGIL
jgi:hypothetical protein